MAQELFEQAQASYDPNQVLELLNHHPYHVDALLAASDLYRTAGQHDTADDMLARCLYGLEMAWPSQFWADPARGMLSIEVEENLPLFKALFRHVQVAAAVLALLPSMAFGRQGHTTRGGAI